MAVELRPRPGVPVGILTERRQPPNVCNARRPRPRGVFAPDRFDAVGKEAFAWNDVVAVAHQRWDVKTGAAVRAAERVARRNREQAARQQHNNAGDALDALVQAQQERHKRLAACERAPPVVARLHSNEPPPHRVPAARPLNPLDAFVQWGQQQRAAPQPVAGKAAARQRVSAMPMQDATSMVRNAVGATKAFAEKRRDVPLARFQYGW